MSDFIGKVFAHSCESMPEIPDGTIQCCVTSPPYYGLRDYGNAEQIGLEPTLTEYVERLVTVFREVRRVLREDGLVFLNLGDSYASQGGPQVVQTRNASRIGGSDSQNGGHSRSAPDGVKPKDLFGVPWTVAFALRADGWWLRDAIVWHKPNPMPSSVDDRCTPCYEMVFMLSKRAQYFSDMDAVREPLADATLERIQQAKWKSGEQAGSTRANGGAKTNGPMKSVVKRTVVNAKGLTRAPQLEDAPENYNLAGANLRNVWTIATTPYADAHFATMPLELALRCIRMGSMGGGIVLDPFAGSGTTFEAAEALGRKWTGYEVNPEYHALIADRVRQAGLFGGVA
jgi:DNA modification methylase